MTRCASQGSAKSRCRSPNHGHNTFQFQLNFIALQSTLYRDKKSKQPFTSIVVSLRRMFSCEFIYNSSRMKPGIVAKILYQMDRSRSSHPNGLRIEIEDPNSTYQDPKVLKQNDKDWQDVGSYWKWFGSFVPGAQTSD